MATIGEVIKREIESELEWKINNFSLSGGYCMSPCFSFEGEPWYLHLILNRTDGFIGLSLLRSLSGSPIEVEIFVALKTTEGIKRFERCERKCFVGLESSYSTGPWISRGEFTEKEFLSSGCLTIILVMKRADNVQPESESGTCQPSGPQTKDKTLHDFKQLFLSQENCDVVLRVQGKEFSAHQAVLVARSPVLTSTFRSNMKEKETGALDIDDIDSSSFSEFLCFLYCGEIDKLSAENAHGLFTAADKYQVMDLRTMCLEFMKKNLSVDTFCETLVLALLHTEIELINSCTDYFVRNAEEIIETVQWQTFAAENPTQSNELFIKYVKSVKQLIKCACVHNQSK